MREAVGKAVERRRLDHGDFITDFIQHALNEFHLAPVLHVQAEVEQRKLQLAHRRQTGMKVFCRAHAFIECIR